MTSLPLALPIVSRGFAALTPAARAEGRRVATAVAPALSHAIGAPVALEGRPLAWPGAREAGLAHVAVALGGVGATASLEIDAGLLARTLARLSARGGGTPAALAPTELEESLLALLALVAIDAAGSPCVDALVPRLALEGELPGEALAIALDIAVGDDRGHGRLFVPAAAIRALGAGMDLSPATAALALPASLREGAVGLTRDELAELAPGDVVLLDDGPSAAELVLPGGLALRGRAGDALFHVEEIRMTETQAAYPITLSVEVARVTVTLGELARVEPGAAIALDARKDGVVVLRAGEHAVARGQLVEIAGALGVRIAELGPLP